MRNSATFMALYFGGSEGDAMVSGRAGICRHQPELIKK